MYELFSMVPEACANTAKIAERCNFDFEFGHTKIPYYKAPDGMDNQAYFEKLCWDGLERRYGPDVHIHVPAGATPKDGPSAGVTLVTALISALTGKTVRGDICMTGEITLRGRVLPVGGIKEKVLAGVARGIGHVILPAKNQKDLEEIPQELRRKIIVHTVDSIDDVLPLVFEKK